MPKEGLEPPCLSTTDPKSVASANFAIWAIYGGEENRTPNPAVQKPCVTISTTPPIKKIETFTRDVSGLIYPILAQNG